MRHWRDREATGFSWRPRSEEHTSELQSHSDLYTLSLHDALPIFLFGDRRSEIAQVPSNTMKALCSSCIHAADRRTRLVIHDQVYFGLGLLRFGSQCVIGGIGKQLVFLGGLDRKSTRLNSSHTVISTLCPYTTLFRSSSSVTDGAK